MTGSGTGLIVSAFGIDTKHVKLVDFYGITSSDFQFAKTEISMLNFVINGNNGFSGVVDSATIINKSIPDPAAVFLLGSACLIGFSGLRRKFKK